MQYSNNQQPRRKAAGMHPFGSNHAAVISAANGKTYFVPFFKKPELTATLTEGGAKKPLNEGDYISLKTYRSQTGRLTPIIYKNEKGRQID